MDNNPMNNWDNIFKEFPPVVAYSNYQRYVSTYTGPLADIRLTSWDKIIVRRGIDNEEFEYTPENVEMGGLTNFQRFLCRLKFWEPMPNENYYLVKMICGDRVFETNVAANQPRVWVEESFGEKNLCMELYESFPLNMLSEDVHVKTFYDQSGNGNHAFE